MGRKHVCSVLLVALACACGDPPADLDTASDDMVAFVDEAARAVAPETGGWDGDGPSKAKTCSTGTGTVFVSYQLTAKLATDAEARALFARLEDHLTSGGREDVEPQLATAVEVILPEYSVTAGIDPRDETVVALGAMTACFST